MKKILLTIDDMQEKQINHIAYFVRTKKGKPTSQKTRILRFCISKTYELYKELKP